MNQKIATTRTFWQILGEKSISIPVIQRDYAQGRYEKIDLRKRFLGAIRDSITGKKPLLLDFVYGTETNGTLCPLDGQQRLTTLWLLHWYALYKKESVDEKDVETLLRFTYETRVSSRDFVKAMANNLLDLRKGRKKGYEGVLSELIQNQNWFFSGWKQDPTVQAMLTSLTGTTTWKGNQTQENQDGIEQLFCKDVDLDILFDQGNCPITFYYLNLDGIKQSDSIYVKMNARGEQLTGFENFKADLVGHMKNNKATQMYVQLPNEGEKNDMYMLKRWDVDWADMFWKGCEDNMKEGCDDAYFSFIKRYLLNHYVTEGAGQGKTSKDRSNPEDGMNNDAVFLMLYNREQGAYTTFELFETFDWKDLIRDFGKVMDILSSETKKIKDAIDDIELLNKKGFSFLPSLQKEKGSGRITVNSYNYQSRVMLHGICKFLAQNNNVDDVAFHHWLRVLANLTYFDEITNMDEYLRRIRNVHKIVMALNGGDIYNQEEQWWNCIDIEKGAFKKQFDEEKEKIQIINETPSYEDVLKGLESLWIFEGRICCLLECLKINDLRNRVVEVIGKSSTDEKITVLFRALLSMSDSVDSAMFNNDHAHYRVLLNMTFKDDFVKIISQDLVPENVIGIYDACDTWKYALVKNIDSIWQKASRGKLEKKATGHYWFKGTYTNKDDILLEDFMESKRALETHGH